MGSEIGIKRTACDELDEGAGFEQDPDMNKEDPMRTGRDPEISESDGPDENRKMIHICKYVLSKLIEAIFVNSLKFI